MKIHPNIMKALVYYEYGDQLKEKEQKIREKLKEKNEKIIEQKNKQKTRPIYNKRTNMKIHPNIMKALVYYEYGDQLKEKEKEITKQVREEMTQKLEEKEQEIAKLKQELENIK